MNPISQTRLSIPGKQTGNCWPACVASLLEIPIEDVPQPPRPGASWEPYWKRFREWTAGRGLLFLQLSGDAEVVAGIEGSERLYWIATGLSPREVRHSVVMRGAKMVHDPHPSGAGVENADTASFFIPLDLGVWKRKETP